MTLYLCTSHSLYFYIHLSIYIFFKYKYFPQLAELLLLMNFSLPCFVMVSFSYKTDLVVFWGGLVQL